jgi:hypothetical protein
MTDHAADRIMQGLNEALAHAKGEMVPDLALHPQLAAEPGRSASGPLAKPKHNSQIVEETRDRP